MELKNPYVLYIGIPVIVVLALIGYGYSKKYKSGKKVANTDYLEATPYFKRKLMAFRFYRVAMIVCLIAALSTLLILISRPSKTNKETTEIHNRDIFLCLDTSGSMYKLDLELCKKMKELVQGLQGERFGITIFNCQTVTLVPLTSDYDYVMEVLDNIEEACRIGAGDDLTYFLNEGYFSKYMYIIDGTQTYDQNGSSLIGDGLASTIFQFPDVMEDPSRTRVIVFATDNQLYGTPFVQLDEAAELCKKLGIIVFGAAPAEVEDIDEFTRCMRLTGGDLFTLKSTTMTKDLVRAIDKTDTSILEKTEVYVVEYPEKLVFITTMALCLYFVISKRIKA
ncbi:MAG: VWA domain-containing protein [Clostridiales bacterium]|nr:VWA domain-containing protein [Clostridiales bacterium]